MPEKILAQLNIARLAYPLDSPQLKDFVDNLDLVNSLAEKSDGFIWRLQTETGTATDIDVFGQNIIVNMSTWRDVDALKHFVFNTVHAQFIKRKHEWFSEVETHMVLWWIPAGTEPTLEQARQKLHLLNQNGASADAFDFKNLYQA